MNKHWLAVAASASLLTVPAMAQDTSGGFQSTTGSMGMQTATVDAARFRDELDTLRGYLNRIQENQRLSLASGDFVHADSFRRNNEILLDNATSLGMTAKMELGSDHLEAPAGYGFARFQMGLVNTHLAHARITGDYSTPIMEAKNALDRVYQHLDRGAMGAGMSGGFGNMNNQGMSGGMGNMNNSGGTGNSGNTNNNTTDPTQNQSNPALNNFNSTNPDTNRETLTDTPNTSDTTDSSAQ